MKSNILKITFIIITLFALYITGIKKYQINQQAYNDLIAAIETKDNLKKLEYIQQIIQIKPDWSLPYILRAKINYLSEKYDEVDKDISIAIKSQPMKCECMEIISCLKTIKNPPKEENKAEAINLIETSFDSVFSIISPITSDWPSWMAYSLVPIFVMIYLTFFFPDYLKSHNFNNLTVLLSLIIIIYFITIFLGALMIEMAPSMIGIAIVIILEGIICFVLHDEFIETFIAKKTVSAGTKFWICKKCQTENTSEHINCWKCSNPM